MVIDESYGVLEGPKAGILGLAFIYLLSRNCTHYQHIVFMKLGHDSRAHLYTNSQLQSSRKNPP
jgi:hypothetical protein